MPLDAPREQADVDARVPPLVRMVKALRRLLARSALLGCVLLLLLFGAVAWLLSSESGGRNLMSALSTLSAGHVQADGWQGRLNSHWQLNQLSLRLPGLTVRVQDLEVDWRPQALWRRHLEVALLKAHSLEVLSAPSPDASAAKPEPPSLPLSLHIARLELAQVRIGQLAEGGKTADSPLILNAIRAALRADARGYQLEGAHVQTPWGSLEAQAQLALRKPYALKASLSFAGRLDEQAASLRAQIDGSYAQPRIRFKAQGAPGSTLAGLSGEGEAIAQPFAPVPLARLQLSLQGLDPQAFDARAPGGNFSLKAQLAPRDAKADWAHWQLTGPLEIINRAPAPIDAAGVPLNKLSTQLSWARGRLALDQLRVDLAGGGALDGALAWLPAIKGDQLGPGRVEARLNVRRLDPSQLMTQAMPLKIDGQISALGDSLRQKFSARLSAKNQVLELEGEHSKDLLRVPKLWLTGAGGEARLQGQLSLLDARAFSVKGDLKNFDPQAFAPQAPKGRLNAQLDLSGQASVDWRVQVQLALSDSQLAGYPLAGGGKIGLSPGRIFDSDFQLAAFDNSLVLQGAFGRPADELKIKIDAPHLARMHAALGGSLKLDANLSGGVSSLVGELSASARALRWQRLSLQSLQATAKLGAGSAGEWRARIDAVGLTQAGELKDNALSELMDKAQLSLSGTRAAHTLRLDAALMRKQSLSLQLAGGVKEDSWQGQLQSVQARGPLRLDLEAPASLRISATQLTLAPARLRAQNGLIELSETSIAAEQVLAKGRISGVELGLSLDENMRRVLSGHSLRLGAEWDLRLGQQANGLLRIFREGGDLILDGDTPVALGLETFEATAALQDGRLTASALANGSRIGNLSVVATAATSGTGASTRLDMNAPIVGVGNIALPDISWIGPFLQQDLRTGGSLQGTFNVLGTLSQPRGRGSIRGEALAIALADQGLRLIDGKLLINLDAEQVKLETLSFKSERIMAPPDDRLIRAGFDKTQGSVSGSGSLQLASGEGRFALRAERVAALQQQNQWMLLSGDAQIMTGWQSFSLNARMKSDAAYIGVPKNAPPRLSDDVRVRGAPIKEAGVAINADIDFDIGDHFLLKAYGIDTWLDGRLRMRVGDRGQLVANGSIRTREGVFDAYGQKLQIERGVVNFVGPLDNPGLNVVALRKGLAVEAGVEVSGTARAPRVRLVSEPNVPEAEKLSWLLLGRASDVNSGDAGLLLSAASAAFGGEGEGVVDRIAKGLGLDEIQVVQSSAGGAQPLRSQVAGSATGLGTSTSASVSDTEQVLTLGKRLSSRAYLAFEQNFVGTQSVVKLTYTLTRFLSLVARAGTDNALDLRYAISFR